MIELTEIEKLTLEEIATSEYRDGGPLTAEVWSFAAGRSGIDPKSYAGGVSALQKKKLCLCFKGEERSEDTIALTQEGVAAYLAIKG